MSLSEFPSHERTFKTIQQNESTIHCLPRIKNVFFFVYFSMHNGETNIMLINLWSTVNFTMKS